MTARGATLVLVRHGATDHSAAKRFSGGLGGDNPGLNEEGRMQAAAAALFVKQRFAHATALVASPVRRTLESAAFVGDALGLPVEEEAGLAEMEFGDWDGLTFLEAMQRDKTLFDAWVGGLDHPPPGGESFRDVQTRVLAGLDRVLAAHPGETVVVVSHVTPIKMLVAHAMGAPLDALFRMDLEPGSVSAVSYFADHATGERRGALKLYNSATTTSS